MAWTLPLLFGRLETQKGFDDAVVLPLDAYMAKNPGVVYSLRVWIHSSPVASLTTRRELHRDADVSHKPNTLAHAMDLLKRRSVVDLHLPPRIYHMPA